MSNQCFTVRAFNIVSAVVNVFDTMITSVVSGFRPLSALVTSTGSTFARKRKVRPFARAAAAGSVFKASKTNSGPKYDPPIPTQIDGACMYRYTYEYEWLSERMNVCIVSVYE